MSLWSISFVTQTLPDELVKDYEVTGLREGEHLTVEHCLAKDHGVEGDGWLYVWGMVEAYSADGAVTRGENLVSKAVGVKIYFDYAKDSPQSQGAAEA